MLNSYNLIMYLSSHIHLTRTLEAAGSRDMHPENIRNSVYTGAGIERLVFCRSYSCTYTVAE